MERYLKNLWLALTGRNPFRQELEEKTDQLAKAAVNVTSLHDLYYAALEKWNNETTQRIEAEAVNDRLARRIGDLEKRIAGMQVLVENLRERVREKDVEMDAAGREFQERMNRMKGEYQNRIEAYNLEIDALRKSLSQDERG